MRRPESNLRSTRQTELAESWPNHVVCAWIGNSEAVARKHYLQVTEEHFQQAAGIASGKGETAQNAAQQDAELSRTMSRTVGEPAKFDAIQPLAKQCVRMMGPVGLEPTTDRL